MSMFQVENVCLTLIVVLAAVVQSSVGYECDKSADICETTLVIEHRLTMMHRTDLKVYPYKGKLYKYDVKDPTTATPVPMEEVITADGWENERLVTVANGSLPGPPIIVYEGQRLRVHVLNKLKSDTVTIHWHGLTMRGTPWMDGSPFITQCPILAGQSFIYDIIAEPKGTHWYHSHVETQRTKGMFGALVIKERTSVIKEHIMNVQDWNHDWNSDKDFEVIFTGKFQDRNLLPPSFSVDGTEFSRVYATSVLINGRGRYYSNVTSGEHNDAPLTVFNVDVSEMYLFRVINVGALYPLRVSIDDHELTIIASDGFDLQPSVAESFIINPGERFDFTITTNQTVGNYWVRAQTLEFTRVHKTEAILRCVGAPDEEPTTLKKDCSQEDRCLVVNCPFPTYPANTYTDCKRFDELKSAMNDSAPEPPSPDKFKEYHLNFGFPTLVSSVNGISFVFPKVSALTQPYEMEQTCTKDDCGEDQICSCTHSISIDHNDVIQIVMVNIGQGGFIVHPIHFHGYSFHVLKMGYGTYNMTTSKFISQNDDIDCRGNGDKSNSLCTNSTWQDPSWLGNNVPGLELSNPPRKNTLIIHKGGYSVVRIKADNPGVWMIHCHIETHAIAGMQLVLNDSYGMQPPTPKGFPVCHNYPSTYRADQEDNIVATMDPIVETITSVIVDIQEGPYGIKTFWVVFAVLCIIILLLMAYIQHLRRQVKDSKENAKEMKIDNGQKGYRL